jgi:hypothetical protein
MHRTGKHDATLQCGDFGIGFPGIELPDLGSNHRIFRGNHDDPSAALEHPAFLPDWGVWNSVFYVSGADSIDHTSRTMGIDWWPDEQLSHETLIEVIEEYSKITPKIVASHDCPQSVLLEMKGDRAFGRSRTRMALQAMLEINSPDLWVFAHHHKTWTGKVLECRFRALNIMEPYVVPINS